VSVSEEFREIKQRVEHGGGIDRFEIIYEHEIRASELLLVDDNGRAMPMSPSNMKDLFGILSRDLTIRCVLLNACYSEGMARALAEHVDCVIGAPSAVKDRAALAFAGAFYEALSFGRDLDSAHRYARNHVRTLVPSTVELPEIHCRPGVDPGAIRLVSRSR